MTSVLSTTRCIGAIAKRNIIGTRRGTGGTDSARYCYSVWFRHLQRMFRQGIFQVPHKVLEFGPGDSLGTGLCALLSGVQEYHAFDVIRHADPAMNRAIFEEIISLFETKSEIPDKSEFPLIHPELDSYGFPATLFTDEVLHANLSASRLDQIRKELQNIDSAENTFLRYHVPWNTADIPPGSIDMICSQSVMEYVDDPDKLYPLMYRWLKPGGVISHEIDFKSMETAKTWNGHWGYSEGMWKVIRGKAEYFVNRFPHSYHIREMKKCGFTILCDDCVHSEPGLGKEQIHKSLIHRFEDSDFHISSAFIQAIKPGPDIP